MTRTRRTLRISILDLGVGTPIMAGVVTSITAVTDVSATGSQVRLLSITDQSMTPPDARRQPVRLKRRGGWIRGRAKGTMSTPLDAQQRQMISDSAQKVRCQCHRHHSALFRKHLSNVQHPKPALTSICRTTASPSSLSPVHSGDSHSPISSPEADNVIKCCQGEW